MPRLLIALILAGFVSACSTSEKKEVIDMDVTFLGKPIDLVLEVKSAEQKFESAPNRYYAEFMVLAPEKRKGTLLHFVLDDLTPDWRFFVVPGTRWKVTCDEVAFDHEKSFGLSFWKVPDLKPEKIKTEANKALVPTVMSVTPAADAPVAPATTAAHL